MDGVPLNAAAELLEQIDSIMRNKGDIETVLDLVDKRILVDILKIEENVCIDARGICKKLQKRRLDRG